MVSQTQPTYQPNHMLRWLPKSAECVRELRYFRGCEYAVHALSFPRDVGSSSTYLPTCLPKPTLTFHHHRHPSPIRSGQTEIAECEMLRWWRFARRKVGSFLPSSRFRWVRESVDEDDEANAKMCVSGPNFCTIMGTRLGRWDGPGPISPPRTSHVATHRRIGGGLFGFGGWDGFAKFGD